MSDQVLEPEVRRREQPEPHRRHQHGLDEHLILTALRPDQVLDQLDGEPAPVELITFGSVRETCPHCPQEHLKLVLRQRRVRMAHLFCAECQACFDAHYPNGAAALSI